MKQGYIIIVSVVSLLAVFVFFGWMMGIYREQKSGRAAGKDVLAVSGETGEGTADQKAEGRRGTVVSVSSLPGFSQAGFSPREKENEAAREDVSNPYRLYLLLSSIDRDIRIMVTSPEGSLVRGVEFKATISSGDYSGQYLDSDRDGMIYAADMKSGVYTVSLSPSPGYVCANAIGRVTVRDEISYSVVSNIRALIYTEEEVDESIEDTADIGEEDDGELLEAGGIDLSGGTIGIDVSKYNKDIDWKKVASTDIGFAIIRLGYRGSSSGTLVVDPYFQKNYEGAREAGIPVGVYFFTQAVNEAEAIEEASMVSSYVRSGELGCPVFIDVESAGGRADGLDRATRTANINAFCKTLSDMGYEVGVYANKTWFTSHIDTSALGDWKIWLAQYRTSRPSYRGEYDCWQYSSKGRVEGITTDVDLDLNLTLGR